MCDLIKILTLYIVFPKHILMYKVELKYIDLLLKIPISAFPF